MAETSHEQKPCVWKPASSDSELVIGLVAPVGTELDIAIGRLKEHLQIAHYEVRQIHVAKDIIKKAVHIDLDGLSPFKQAMEKMNAGNEARKTSQDNAILMLGVAQHIVESRCLDNREIPKPAGRLVHIIRSIKHPEEVERLREIYPQGFYLIGVNADKQRRQCFLTNRRGMNKDEAKHLMQRDENEHIPHGQRQAAAFHMADFFVRIDDSADQITNSLSRIVDIIMGYPYHTPTFDEYAMFLAFSASLRSADLSRQVGAVIANEEFREIMATGANDCPRAGGGLYWPVEEDGKIVDEADGRDYKREKDPNFAEKAELIGKIASKANEYGLDAEEIRNLLENSDLQNITEFGRVVHAEMEALLACARNGLNTRNATLYATTFPCHNCTKHIVAAGISRVVYVEPYAKSKAQKLHNDSIAFGLVDHAEEQAAARKKVRFEPFIGVGPRRFFDLFSTRLGTGRHVPRKTKDGETVEWRLENAVPRRQMLPYSYLELEAAAAKHFERFEAREEAQDGQ